jgi:DNA-binding transcriptional regulator of glucitol operon
MATKKRLWFWNILIVLTIIVCSLAFAAHYKNWTRIEPDQMTILSGIYYHDLKYEAIDSVLWVDRIPPMERLNGFSAFDKGKGVFREFKDSLTDKKVYVFVDNYANKKIRFVNKDASQLFLNLKDSTETEALYEFFENKLADTPE